MPGCDWMVLHIFWAKLRYTVHVKETVQKLQNIRGLPIVFKLGSDSSCIFVKIKDENLEESRTQEVLLITRL